MKQFMGSIFLLALMGAWANAQDFEGTEEAPSFEGTSLELEAPTSFAGWLPEARALVEEEREAGNLGGSIVRALRAEAEPTTGLTLTDGNSGSTEGSSEGGFTPANECEEYILECTEAGVSIENLGGCAPILDTAECADELQAFIEIMSGY
jgi:hypothetical protein